MADALASGASGSNIVWVQVPFPAFANNGLSYATGRFEFKQEQILYVYNEKF